ncbi:MAG: excisionase [Stutzerimonas stutzeri]|nr:MAG: excisionase [Stutzerimonas stutzeri]
MADMAVIEQDKPLAYSVKEACRISSLGRTLIYQLIASGRLEARKLGRRTLIPASSLHKLLEGNRDEA